MHDILQDRSDAAVAAAISGNLRAAFLSLPRPSSLRPSDDSDTARWLLPVDHPWFRGVWSDAAPSDEVDDDVASSIASFREHGVASFTWWLSTHVDPEPWQRALQRHGLRHDDGPPGMAIDLDDLPSLPDPALDIRTVEDARDATTFAETMARGFGDLPEEGTRTMVGAMGLALPWRHYLGVLDEEAVATSTLFLGAGVAGVYNVATVPEARRRGIGAAMTRVALAEARAMGYRVGVLQSSDAGASVYRRMGFRDYGRIAHFVWGDAPED